MKKIRVRYPPSPTGYCHIGTARMALLNYMFAKRHGGTIVLRIEDTDRERSTIEFEDDIKESLRWLALPWDDFARQSERLRNHKAAILRLIGEGKAYVSEEESKKEAGKKIAPVRLRNSGRQVTFTDIIRGDITFDTTDLGDFVIARAVDDPLYHLAVVVDDAEMDITHVIRGEDHISNTPRQILIQEALGYGRPLYAHFPLHLAADRSKLSKRKGDVAVRDYRAQGFLPEAMLNYLAVVGWTPPSGREILTLQEMTDEFELTDIHKSGGIFDLEKLHWYNRQYLMALEGEVFAQMMLPVLQTALKQRNLPWDPSKARSLMPLLKEWVSVARDVVDLATEGEFDLFFSDPQLAATRIPDKKSNVQEAAEHLAFAHDALAGFADHDWNEVTLKETLWTYASEKGRGAVLWPLRYALSGRVKSPDPFAIAAIIGKEATLRRIEGAIQMLKGI